MLLSTQIFAPLKFSARKLALVKTVLASGLGVLAWGTSSYYLQAPQALYEFEVQNPEQATPNGAQSKTAGQKPSPSTEKQAQANTRWVSAIRSTVNP